MEARLHRLFRPIYATPTKPGRPAIGLAEIRLRFHPACAQSTDLLHRRYSIWENAQQVIDAGARRVVGGERRHSLGAKDIQAATCRELKSRVPEYFDALSLLPFGIIAPVQPGRPFARFALHHSAHCNVRSQ
jgi:hypothetical protein